MELAEEDVILDATELDESAIDDATELATGSEDTAADELAGVLEAGSDEAAMDDAAGILEVNTPPLLDTADDAGVLDAATELAASTDDTGVLVVLVAADDGTAGLLLETATTLELAGALLLFLVLLPDDELPPQAVSANTIEQAITPAKYLFISTLPE